MTAVFQRHTHFIFHLVTWINHRDLIWKYLKNPCEKRERSRFSCWDLRMLTKEETSCHFKRKSRKDPTDHEKYLSRFVNINNNRWHGNERRRRNLKCQAVRYNVLFGIEMHYNTLVLRKWNKKTAGGYQGEKTEVLLKQDNVPVQKAALARAAVQKVGSELVKQCAPLIHQIEFQWLLSFCFLGSGRNLSLSPPGKKLDDDSEVNATIGDFIEGQDQDFFLREFEA